MINPEQVPPDAMYAAWKAMNAGMTLNDAIAAALNAWPGMKMTPYWEHMTHKRHVEMILPLTENPSD